PAAAYDRLPDTLMNAPATPRPAATTILLRPGKPLEVFLIKRTPNQRFMGGTHVFPGGRMDEADLAAAGSGVVKRADVTALAAHMGLSSEQALGYLITAARELLEEAGILLCHGASAEDARWVRQAAIDGQPFGTAVRARGL